MNKPEFIAVTIHGQRHLLTRSDASFLFDSLDAALLAPAHKTVSFTRKSANCGRLTVHVERSTRAPAATVTDC